jgi:5,5'-dehydrodivanillate O-demethylase
MLSREQNERLCRVARGTPMGDLLRRFWQPVGISAEVKSSGQPKPIKVMGEELVLFRTDTGLPGLLGRRCAHRLTSLAYGRVEDGGLRCPFHGWLYDVNGHCIQQPAEPLGSTFKDKIRHTAYPCRDLGGLIFAYMGPEDRQPLLPNYETLVRNDGTRVTDVYAAGGNFLQHIEGALDTTHLSYLHANHWSRIKEKLFAMPKPEIDYVETDYGLWQKSLLPNMTDYGEGIHGIMQTLYTYFVMPAGFLRVQEHTPGSGMIQKTQSWYVPIDDTNTARYQVGFSPPWPDGRPFVWSNQKSEDPSAANDYFRNYDATDTISGIPLDAHLSPVQEGISFIPQDMMANEEQGDIVDRSLEHLGAHEGVITAMRAMYFRAMDEVKAGRDPKHIIRDSVKNEVVYIRGMEEKELV